MGKGVLNIKYFHSSLTDEDKQQLVAAYKKQPSSKKLNELPLYDMFEASVWDEDDYENDCRGLPFTCSAAELSTPFNANTLAKGILTACWRGQKYVICNTVSPNEFLDKMGFKLQTVFMGNHKKNVYSYQMRLDNLVV